MDVRMPDGTIVQNVPDGTTQAEIQRRMSLASASPAPSAAPAPIKPPEKPLTGMSFLGDVARGGVQGMVQGGPLGAISGMAGPGNKLAEKAFREGGARVGEAATKYGTQLGLPPSVTAGVATAGDLGVSEILPGMIGGGVGAKGAKAMKGGAEWLMENAIKPLKAEVKSGRAATAIQTMLDEGLNVTKGGVEKLKARIDDLNHEVEQKIAASPEYVDKLQVAQHFRDSINEFKHRTDAAKKFDEIYDAWKEFLSSPAIKGGSKISVQQAQKTKQAISKQVGEAAYDPSKRDSATVSALKDIQTGLREGVASKVPEVVPLNERESKLLSTLSVVEQRTITEARKNPMGLAAFAIQNPKEFAAFMMDRSAPFKSWLANILHQNQRAPAIVGAGVGAGAGHAAQIQPPPQGQ